MLCKGFIINAKNYLNVFWPFSHCVSSVLWLVKARPGKRYNVYTKMKCSDRMCCKYLYPWLSVTDWKFMVHIDRAILAIIVCTLLWPPSRHVGGVWRCSKWKVHYMVAWDFTQENVWNTVPSWKILESDWHFFVWSLFALAWEFPQVFSTCNWDLWLQRSSVIRESVRTKPSAKVLPSSQISSWLEKILNPLNVKALWLWVAFSKYCTLPSGIYHYIAYMSALLWPRIR